MSKKKNKEVIERRPTEVHHKWTQEEFENYLLTKEWPAVVKDMHRAEFKGDIVFADNQTIYYP